MTKQRTLICSACPNECTLEFTIHEPDQPVADIRGNGCERGSRYAWEEIFRPSRIATTTIPISGGFVNRLPVRSSGPLPKTAMMDWIRLVKGLQVTAPVLAGEVLMPNALGTGTDVISSRSVAKRI